MDYFYASTFANGYAPGLMDARIGAVSVLLTKWIWNLIITTLAQP